MPFPFYIIFVLIFVGVILWAITKLPMDPAIAQVIRVLVIVFVVLWLLYALMGMFGGGMAPYTMFPRRP